MFEDMMDDEDREILDGADEDDDLVVTSGEQLDGLLDRFSAKRVPDLKALRIMSRAQFPQSGSTLKPKVVAGLGRLKRMAAGMAAASGKIEADWLRRPNQHCGFYGPNLAPATASSEFSITPSGGAGWYRVLGILMTPGIVERIGFKSLIIGGLEHINAPQASTSPTSPVANLVPAAGFVVGDASDKWNIAPFTGYVFDNATPMRFTLGNMTTPGAGDAETIAPRGNLPIQTDPCGQGYQNVKATAGQWIKKYRRALASYHRGALF